MRIARVALVGLLFAGCVHDTALAEAAPPAEQGDPHRALARACRWLWARQGSDGGWHSEEYALLRSGQAYTPFVLSALLDVPEDVCPRPRGGVERALGFLRRHLNDDGVIGLSDPDIMEYPNYSTAYALRCLLRAGSADDKPLIDQMRRYLQSQQYREATGFDPSHPAFGGWGFGGVHPPGEPGHMDLAHTRRVLAALRASGLNDELTFGRAQQFLRLVQRHPDDPRPQPATTPSEDEPPPYDGGFYFSPVVPAANKGRGEAYFRSYATATCDGILALLAAEVPRDDERVRRALQWLREHPSLESPGGIPRDHPEPWDDALHFYHVAVRAEVYAELGGPVSWKDDIRRLLESEQLADGRFENRASPLMKEDDPLLATALAAVALSRCR